MNIILTENQVKRIIKEHFDSKMGCSIHIPTAEDNELVDYANEWKDNGATFEEWKNIVRQDSPCWVDKYSDEMLKCAWEQGVVHADNINEEVDEKAKSKAQQRFFGMVDAYKKGEMPNASKAIKKAAKSMTKKQVKDFAETKHKGLPNHVNEDYNQFDDGDYAGNTWSSYSEKPKSEKQLYGDMVKVSAKRGEFPVGLCISYARYKQECEDEGFRFKPSQNLMGGYYVDDEGNCYKFVPKSEYNK